MKVDDLFSKTIPTSGISELVWKTLIRRTLICKMAEQDIPPPHITAMKIPIIRKGEYDIWSMRMRKIYMSHTAINKPIGDVIVNGDLEEEPAPTEKDFCNVTDAKSLWEAIKSRFGGLVQTSASQNLAFLSSENTSSTNEVSTASGDFGVSTAGGINQVPSTSCAHDVVAMLTVRVKKFIQRTGRNMDFKEKRHVSLDKSKIKCNNCHRKGHFARECRPGRNQGRRSYGDNGRSNTPTNESSSQALMAQDGLGGYDWSNDFEVESVNYALMAISTSSSSSSSDSEEESTKNLDEIHNSQMSTRDKTSLGYGTQLNELSSNHETDSENSLSIFDVRSSDEENTPENDRFQMTYDEYAIRNKIIESQTTELITKTSETAGQTNDANTEKPKSASESVVSNPKIDRDRVIIEDWNSDDEEKSQEPKLKTVVNTGLRVDKPVWDNTKRVNHQKFSKYPHLRKAFVPSGVLTRIGLITPVKQNKKRAVHKVSTDKLISTARPVSSVRSFAPKIAQTSGVIRPIYPRMDNVRPRGSYSPIKRSYYTKPASRPKYLKQYVKTFGVQNMITAGSRAVVNTGKGKMDTGLKKSRWVWRPKENYLDHVSKDSRSFMLKKVEYVEPKGISKSIMAWDHAVVDSGCSSHMTGNKAYLSNYEDYNGGFVTFGSDPKGGKITGKGKIRTANLDFDDVYFVDELKFNLFSISQMCDKKNSVLFTETECLILSPSFKLLDESQVVLRAPRKDDVYSLNLKNIVPSGGITCLYANATADESKLWHRRLGHVNFKNINKLVKGHLVRGLPSKVFVNDHTCVACKKGKQHKASCKAKLERIIRKPLELLHMDLFGPVSVESINKKRYCLVVTDDFSRFSWVFFLATKDETSEILYKFIIGLENQLNLNVKIIRCDNGTEFKNHAMNELCAKKGIKREFSVARTPQQNGVAERKNRTLIEAARTIKAFRVYNKRTKRVEENLHIDFLEDQPNVAGTGPNWMFNLDFLTNSINYIPVSVENQVNVDAGTQDSYVSGSSGKDKEPSQEYILLLLHPHRTRILVEDVAPAAHEKPSEISFKVNDVQDSEDVADKEGQHKMTKDEQCTQTQPEGILLVRTSYVAKTSLRSLISVASEQPLLLIEVLKSPLNSRNDDGEDEDVQVYKII
ncbi:putative ribonuclease H-like domain-containing protein [Tanacetum coccineum]